MLQIRKDQWLAKNHIELVTITDGKIYISSHNNPDTVYIVDSEFANHVIASLNLSNCATRAVLQKEKIDDKGDKSGQE